MDNDSISENITRFRNTKKIRYLARAAVQISQQSRVIESVYGIYCSIFHNPSCVKHCDHDKLRQIIGELTLHRTLDGPYLSREQLIHTYRQDFLAASLPQDFAGARRNSIVCRNDLLIIGEYGNESKGSRIALITQKACMINDHYAHDSHVFHIHALHGCRNSRKILVTTGDSAKFLDLWELIEGNIVFVRRMRKRLAGYTAIAGLDDRLYFGTDFSGRPNYIETLEGQKYFFPHKAYKRWVLAFFPVSDRYLVCVSAVIIGRGRTVSVFDAVQEEFILCEEFDFMTGQMI